MKQLLLTTVHRLAGGVFVTPIRTHTGYIGFEGRRGRDPNTEISQFIRLRRNVDLTPIKKVTASFDPFTPRIADIRSLMQIFSMRRIRKTNIKCMFKNEIRTDRAAPEMAFELTDGRKVVFKMANLSDIDVLEELAKITEPMKMAMMAASEVPTKGTKKMKGK